MKNIAGVFFNRLDANQAVAALMDQGFSKHDISVLMSDKTRDKYFSDEQVEERDEAMAKGGATGAFIGGAIGALIAGLTAVGSIAVPGVGLLAAGPIVAALSGAGAGAAVGGLAGALINAGFSHSEARHYEDEIKAGKVVVVVHTRNEEQVLAANEVMRMHTAQTEAV